MNHPSETMLQAYLDDELPGEQRRAVEAHLEACSNCQERLAELVTLFAQLQTVPERSLSRDLSGQVVAAVRSRRKESALVARLAWAEALVAFGLGVIVWVFTGGTVFAGFPTSDLTGGIERMVNLAGALLEAQLEWTGQLPITLENVLTEVARFPPGNLVEVTGWISWGPALALAFALWLIGNGVLLRGGGEQGRR